MYAGDKYAGDEYAYHGTPSMGDAEVSRNGDQFQVIEGRPVAQQGYVDPRAPPLPPVNVSEAVGLGHMRDNIISVHGYMHKQGKRTIKGPIHKSWKRRYFGRTPRYLMHTFVNCANVVGYAVVVTLFLSS